MGTLLSRFETYLQQHSLAPVTVRNYIADLRSFLRWHADHHLYRTGAEFAFGDWDAYRDHLCNETDHSPATINRRLQSLRLFGRFLLEIGQVSQDPASEIKLVHNGNGNGMSPRILSRAEIVRLHDAIRTARPSLVLRDLAIVQLMLHAGLRVHEVAALQLRDFAAWRRGHAEVGRAVHAGERSVPLDATARRALREYLTVRPAIPRVEHLFVSQRGQPLSMRSIQRIIGTHARAAGLSDVCAQSLRHTCAKVMLEKTNDAALVARWLGHRSTRILGKYK